MTRLHNLKSLLKNKRLSDGHPLHKLPKDDQLILDKTIGIACEKNQESGKSVRDLRGRLCDPKSYLGLLGELFWCHRLTQLGCSFEMEDETGGGDFRIILDNRTIFAEVKTLQKPVGTKKDNDLSSRLLKAIKTQTDNFSSAFLITITFGPAFSDQTIKPLLREIKFSLEQVHFSKEEFIFSYPVNSADTNNCQAEVSIKRTAAEKSNVLISRGTFLIANDTLLRNNLDKANQQLDKKNINVVFVDRTGHATDDEDVLDALYGKSVCYVSFDKNSGEINMIEPDRLNNGFFRDGSSISAVIVYRRNGISGITDYRIECHPKFCKLTGSEIKYFEEIFES